MLPLICLELPQTGFAKGIPTDLLIPLLESLGPPIIPFDLLVGILGPPKFQFEFTGIRRALSILFQNPQDPLWTLQSLLDNFY